MKWYNLIVLISFCIIGSCVNTKSAKRDHEYLKNGYTIAKVIDNTEIAGCGFILELQDSTLLTPSKIGDEFKINNLKVYVKYEVLKKQPITNCMRGKVVNISEIIIADKKQTRK